jgi:hypothetical protein
MRRSIIALWALAARHGLRAVVRPEPMGPKLSGPKLSGPKPSRPELSGLKLLGPKPPDLS